MTHETPALAASEVSTPGQSRYTIDARSALGLIGDPIAVVVLRVTRDPSRIWLAWFAFALLTNGAAGVLLAISDGEPLAAPLQDRVILFGELVVAPIAMATYTWAPRELLRIIAVMADQKVVDARDDDWDWLAHRLGSRLVPITQLLVGAAFLVGADLVFASFLREQAWTHDPRVFLLKAPEWFALFVTAGGALIRVLTLIQFQLRVFGRGRSLLVRPLDDDGCGGLRSLAKVAIWIAPVVGLAGAALALAEVDYSVTPGLVTAVAGLPLHALVLLYVFTSLGALLTPFLAVHARMVETKRAILNALRRERDRRYVAALDDLASEGQVDVDAQALHATDQFRRTLERDYPEWPLDFRSLRLIIAALFGEPGVTFLAAVSVEMLRTRLPGN